MDLRVSAGLANRRGRVLADACRTQSTAEARLELAEPEAAFRVCGSDIPALEAGTQVAERLRPRRQSLGILGAPTYFAAATSPGTTRMP